MENNEKDNFQFESEVLNFIFDCGKFLEYKLKRLGYCSEEGCVGTCNNIDDDTEDFVRSMDFEYSNKELTQEILDAMAPKYIRFELYRYKDDENFNEEEEGETYGNLFCVGVSLNYEELQEETD